MLDLPAHEGVELSGRSRVRSELLLDNVLDYLTTVGDVVDGLSLGGRDHDHTVLVAYYRVSRADHCGERSEPRNEETSQFRM